MSNVELVMFIGGVLATVLGGIDSLRSSPPSLTSIGVVVLGIVFIILAFI
jgi:hypothetical protein